MRENMYYGVSSHQGRFRVRLGGVYLGTFVDEMEAALAVDAQTIQNKTGDRLNFPIEPVRPGCRFLQLRDGKWAIIDSRSYGCLANFTWGLDGGGYVCRWHKGGTVYLHSSLLPKAKMVDHINRNKLDNRACNLRPCTNQQNTCNRVVQPGKISRYRGVRRGKRSRTWTFQLKCRGAYVASGTFDSEQEAALAYNEAAKEWHGEFAVLNQVTV